MSGMGQHSRPTSTAPPGGHPALSLLLSMGAAILVTAVVFGSTGFADRDADPAQPRANTPAAASGSARPQGPQSPLGRPTLELRWTNGTSWVRVTDAKGAVVINDIFAKGTVKKFTGPSFRVEIGNAGAVTMVDKGGRPKVAGVTGQVARSTVTGP